MIEEIALTFGNSIDNVPDFADWSEGEIESYAMDIEHELARDLDAKVAMVRELAGLEPIEPIDWFGDAEPF